MLEIKMKVGKLESCEERNGFEITEGLSSGDVEYLCNFNSKIKVKRGKSRKNFKSE